MGHLLAYLPVLACPIMMILCIKMMGSSRGANDDAHKLKPSSDDRAVREEVAALHEEIARLRADSALASTDRNTSSRE